MAAEGGRDRAVFLGAMSVFVALNIPMIRFERVMRSANDRGIVALELAGSPTSADVLLNGWGEAGRRAAHRSLCLDFLYLTSYTASQVCALRRVAAVRGPSRGGRWARTLVPVALAAGGCDAVEGVALLTYLHGGAPAAPLVARRAAQIKFALLAVVLANLASSPRELRRGLLPG
ncbi:hypothetical protein CC117_09830 [Parafrankia colletiae]|uniref:Uncharacterized protein n=1 Tax=Parafrankia colletiae TaxID=573497 RepID=A0A1S1RHX5_9ACTN|nr:hypothetical protein [Parafrankia colletiae]OHV44985.1 hypothetical protein CC117_09830 [Parafrankia colletiae]